jgi:integrase
VLRWCVGIGRSVANNTVRNRLSLATVFLRWCVREGHADPGMVEVLTDRDNPLRRVPRLYGKVQAKHPARWLTHDEAFGQLLSTCASEGEIGLRDELVLRLGLAGLRAAEIIALEVGDLQLGDDPPQIRWIGKARRSRRIVPGAALIDLLRRYLGAYEAAAGSPLSPEAPLICRGKTGAAVGQVTRWDEVSGSSQSDGRSMDFLGELGHVLVGSAGPLGEVSPTEAAHMDRYRQQEGGFLQRPAPRK